ncbi:glycosyltransferase family 2 protein [Sedimentitalea todarodis]|uniref:Glycosyltransferase family 2 protein n=1 Tax=Sedimentitalea todarodis TaxID=1631240 RepID=A0ABU3V926_9RHOB|nr:glycosyltransferase family 2 protein [Sedimentitalea todarodis]MDU9002677.1 glycosyltransferase family 2 protein [Sedimentitalea todarodis]
MQWGLVATIKAPTTATLNFVAHHLELGAHRIYVYLDEPDPATFALLKSHPKVRVTTCDDAYWSKHPRRPKKHQVRQSSNATHAYGRAEVDWLAHIDVDEFLCSDAPIIDQLAALPDKSHCARLYPAEALAGDGSAFKLTHRTRAERAACVERLYPTYGRYLDGGFLSHVEGKLFVRTGLSDVTLRIHNVFQGEIKNPGERSLDQITLCHCHAQNWDAFIAAYRFRLERGSYRADLAPMRPATDKGVTLHALLMSIDQRNGADGLRRFYDELFADTPDHRQRLQDEGLLYRCDLQLARSRRKQFPDFS